MWEFENSPYLPCSDLPYGRITSRYENQGRGDSMSIAIGLIGTDGIVLATDSRMSVGTETGVHYPDDNSQKLWKLTDNLGLTSVGSQQGYRQFILEMCQRKLKESNMNNLGEQTITTLTDTVRNDFIHQIQGFGTLAKELLMTRYGMMVAGYDDSDSPIILSMRAYITSHDIPFVPDVRHYYCIDSADGTAEYIMAKTNMVKQIRQGINIHILKKLAVLLIEETKISTDAVGGNTQMATITKDGGFEFVEENDIKKITEDTKVFIGNMIGEIVGWLNRM
jgi:20S proteasome alpha/beta subunit